MRTTRAVRSPATRDGLLKLLFEVPSKKLLGVHIIGEGATELIHIGQMVMTAGGSIDVFIDSVFNFPTLSELYKYAAYDGLGRLARRTPDVTLLPRFLHTRWASRAESGVCFLPLSCRPTFANGMKMRRFPRMRSWSAHWQFPCSAQREALSRMRCRVAANAPREGSYARCSVSAKGDRRELRWSRSWRRPQQPLKRR